MLCQLEENDEVGTSVVKLIDVKTMTLYQPYVCIPQEMSACYWPSETDETQAYGKVIVKKLTEERHGDFVWRTFEVDAENKQGSTTSDVKTAFTVTQFQFMVWPEHETPPITTSLIEMIDNVTKVQMGSVNRPMIVMCK